MTAYTKPYWVYTGAIEQTPCECCHPALALEDEYWECVQTGQKWPILDAEPSAEEAKSILRDFALKRILSDDGLWGDITLDLETALLNLESATETAARLAKAAQVAEEARLHAEATAMSVYTRKMAEAAMRGVKMGQGPKKLDKPCKWCCGKEAAESKKKGEPIQCWAWEYVDPKTKQRKTPRTCMYQHPGEAGWHKEWETNPSFKPDTTGAALGALRGVQPQKQSGNTTYYSARPTEKPAHGPAYTHAHKDTSCW